LKGVDDDEMKALGVDGTITKEEFDSLPLPEKYIISKCHLLV
jgi:valyl-tRNA synthetase